MIPDPHRSSPPSDSWPTGVRLGGRSSQGQGPRPTAPEITVRIKVSGIDKTTGQVLSFTV